MDKIKVIVIPNDYDVDWCVELYDPEQDDAGDAVEVDADVYKEYCDIDKRYGEMEDFFLGLESPNYKEWHLEREEKDRLEKERRIEYIEKVMADPAYKKSQEKLNASRKK